MSATFARDWLGRLYYNLRYRFETSPITAAVAGATARFDVSDRESDYFHVRMLAHERPILADCLAEVRPDDVFWDVGAKIGLYSWLIASVGPSVHAFEPTPTRAARWRRNAAVNPDAEATLHTCALSFEAGEAEMGEGNVAPDGVAGLGPAAERFTAQLRRGDDLIQSGGAPAPDVLKVDTEGYELNVLRGLSGTFESDPPRALYVETHTKMDRFGQAEGDLFDFLAGYGYERRYIESEYPHGNTAHYKFWRPDG